MTRYLLLIGFIFFAACSDSDDKRIDTGVEVTGDSTELAQFLSNAAWCNEDKVYADDDVFQREPYLDVTQLFSSGDAKVAIVRERDLVVVDEVSGKWGASDSVIALDIQNERYEGRVVNNGLRGDGTKVMAIELPDGSTENFYECNF